MNDRDRHAGAADAAGILTLLETELSRGQRRRAIATLCAAFVVTGPLVTLWATEPRLPLRTHLAFAGLVVIGFAWIATSLWILAARRPLYARDRVVATGLAVVACLVAGGASILVASARGTATATAVATITTVALLGLAGALHVQARRRRDELLRRRRALEAGV